MNTENCPLHGPFVPELLAAPFPGFPPIRRGCPPCSHAAAQAEIAARCAADFAELLQNSNIPQDYQRLTLAGFPKRTRDEAGSNAVATALGTCEWFLDRYEELRVSAEYGSWLVFVGPPGAGKTGMACSVALELMRPAPPRMPRSAIYHTVASLRRWVWDAKARGSHETAAVERLAHCELLVLDEVGATTGSDAERATVLDVLNERYARKRPLILISNLDRRQMESQMEPRLMDRLAQRAAWVSCQWSSLRRPEPVVRIA